MNKKGFVLMETIVVILIVSVALLTLFSSFNKILTKMKTQNRYDTPEYIYMVNYIKERMQKNSKPNSPGTLVFDFSIEESGSGDPYDFLSNTCTYNASTKPNCFTEVEKNVLKKVFNAKSIYIVTGIQHSNTLDNLKKFPPSVAEYIKKLDVSEIDEIIIVVFERPVLDENGNVKEIYCSDQVTSRTYCNSSSGTTDDQLKNIYIASLKW